MDTNRFKHIKSLAEYMDGADHIDVRSTETDLTLREFAAGLLSYEPGWMRALWHVRVHLLRLLRQGEHEAPEKGGLSADTLPVKPGEKAGFFTVAESDGETFWVVTGEESHLGAALGVVGEPAPGGRTRYHVITAVQYRNWAGPIYFNLIRPFHHLIVILALRSLTPAVNLADFTRISLMAEYMDGADHIDVKTGEGCMTLREFVAGLVNYQPGWMRFLWKVRDWMLPLLGQTGEVKLDENQRFTPETLPLTKGEMANFFRVEESDGETYWAVTCNESQMATAVGIFAEPVPGRDGCNRFSVVTTVTYQNLAGAIEFNLIRPFHHLVVRASIKGALAGKSGREK